MKKETRIRLRPKSNAKPKDGHTVNLVIKFNPHVVFKVCSMCHEDMERLSQRPFTLFASNGIDPVCWKCGDEISPEYADMLSDFYLAEHVNDRLDEIRCLENSRLKRLDTQRRDSLIKEITSNGITEKQLRFVVKTYDWYKRAR